MCVGAYVGFRRKVVDNTTLLEFVHLLRREKKLRAEKSRDESVRHPEGESHHQNRLQERVTAVNGGEAAKNGSHFYKYLAVKVTLSRSTHAIRVLKGNLSHASSFATREHCRRSE